MNKIILIAVSLFVMSSCAFNSGKSRDASQTKKKTKKEMVESNNDSDMPLPPEADRVR